MANLATISNNLLADSGVDPINVVVTSGSYSNPAWITALSWSKITGTPTTLAGYGITNGVPTSRTLTINGVAQDLSADRSWTIAAGVSSIVAGAGISVSGTSTVTVTNTGVLSINGSTGAVTGIITTSNYNSYSPTLTGGGASGTWGINITGTASLVNGTSGGAIQSWDIRTISPSSMTTYRMGFGFTSWANNNTSPYADYIHLRSYSDSSGGADNLLMFLKSGFGIRIYQQSYGSSTPYSSYKDVAWTDGTNASGTWGINITGTAASETLATVTGRGNTTGSNVISSANMYAASFIAYSNNSYYLTPDGTSTLYSANINRAQITNDVTTSSGQGRFGGWYTGTGYTGAAVEIGYSGGGQIIAYNRQTSAYQPMYISASNIYLQQQSGYVWINSALVRQAAAQGWLSGNYSSSETTATTGAIYSIGGSYYPNSTTLNTMYGVGYTYSDQGQMVSGASGWGFYTAANGVSRIWLGAESGHIFITGNYYSAGNIVATQSWSNSSFVPIRGQSNWNDGTVINDVIGLIAWKNYNNGHVIFDASAGTSPSGGGVSQTNATYAWTASYPTLMGWNGSQTYGVRVDSARVADSATSASYLTGGDSAAYMLLYNALTGDLNTYNSPGLYSAEYTGSTNRPIAQNGSFIQISDAGGTDVKTQWYYSSDGANIYMRLQWGNTAWRSWRTLITDYNIGSQTVANSNALNGWAYTSYAYRASGSGYYQVDTWMSMNGNHGIYWPSYYGLHLYPNQNTYGALQINGSKNSWAGIYFDYGGNTLMMNSNESGHYRESYGWQFRWYNGGMYVSTAAQGGGSEGTVWHSINAPRAANSLLMYYQGFTLDANTMDGNSTGFTYAVNAPYTGPIARFSETGYSLQLNAAYGGSGTQIAFRTRNGDAGTFNPWRALLNDSNYANWAVNRNGDTLTNAFYFQSNLGAYCGSLSSPPLQAYATGGNSAFMSFHRGGNYAVNMGLDADNVLRIGGWSASANRWVLDMSGNNTVAGYMSANAHFDGPLATNRYGASSGTTTGRVYGPSGAAYSYSGGSITGAIKIRLPFRANDCMWSMKVRIYNYSQQQTCEYILGNYSYSNGGWNSSATFIGGNSSSPQLVRFGNDGSYDCVWIGETSTTWSYPVVSVMDFMSGYSNGSYANNYQNWDISIVGAFGTVQQVIAADAKFSSTFATYYYDSGNTNYYVSPSGTTILNTLNFGTAYMSGTLRNNGSVSEDDGFGIYWDSGGSTAYAIYREAGSWGHPYPDLRIAFHTGISLGANPNYGGIRFFTDYDMGTVVLYVNNGSYGGGGNVYATGSITASSFYEISDARTKTILDDNHRVNDIHLIKPKLYKKDGRVELGYIAQEFTEKMPYALTQDGEEKYYSLIYREVHTAKIAYLEDSIEEIKAKIINLENQLKTKQ